MHSVIYKFFFPISCLFLNPESFYDDGISDNTSAMLNTSGIQPIQSFFLSSFLLSAYSGEPGEYDGEPGEY